MEFVFCVYKKFIIVNLITKVLYYIKNQNQKHGYKVNDTRCLH
jgi:hypothetical protein